MRGFGVIHVCSHEKVLFSRRTPKDFTWLLWRICGLVVSAILLCAAG